MRENGGDGEEGGGSNKKIDFIFYVLIILQRVDK
jgi:hypothetical protein